SGLPPKLTRLPNLKTPPAASFFIAASRVRSSSRVGQRSSRWPKASAISWLARAALSVDPCKAHAAVRDCPPCGHLKWVLAWFSLLNQCQNAFAGVRGKRGTSISPRRAAGHGRARAEVREAIRRAQ